MRTFFFSELNSTSDTAKTLAREIAQPFAVISLRQRQGRGQRGRTWCSPKGNLYLSLVLDAKVEKEAAYFPLRVASHLAEWLRSECGIDVVIKWPNDILFAGRKLAGILCEKLTSHRVVIGVGLNIHTSPTWADGERGEETICLRDIIGSADLNRLGFLAPSLIRALQQCTDGPAVSELHQHWRTRGHIFVETETQARWIDRGLDPSGAWRIEPAEGGEQKLIHSASAPFRWWFQPPLLSQQPLSIVDIGNTHTKLAAYRSGTGEPRFFQTVANEQEAVEILSSWRAPVFYGAVSQKRRSAFLDAVANQELPPVFEIPKRRLRSYGEYPVDQLGLDRLAAIEAALHPQQSTVIVSAGTALTIDLLAGRHHRGGLILPGLGLSATALTTSTDLPRVAVHEGHDDRHDSLGCDTHSALAKGMVEAIVALILNVATPAYHSSALRILVTGGDANFLTSRLLARGANAVSNPHLVVDGLRFLATGGAR